MPYRHQSPDALHRLLRQALELHSARKNTRSAFLAPHSALRHKLPERFAYFYQMLRRLPRKVRRYWRLKLGASLAGAALALTLSSTPVAHAAEISVTTNATAVSADDGLCSLIEAIINANDDAATYAACAVGSGADTITLAGDVYIVSNSYESGNGLPIITSDITIQGNGATIKGNATGYRIIKVANTGALSIYDTTISGGWTSQDGGGIYNSGVVTITNSTISNNFDQFLPGGGGIYNEGDMTLVNSTVSGNTTSGANGAGIYNDGDMTLVNSTISNNNALYDYDGAGILHRAIDGGNLTITNSIIADNTGNSQCYSDGFPGSKIHASYSLIEGGLGCVNGTNINNLTADPKLGPLQDNGGPTFTHALLDGSPAIDAGSNAAALDAAGQPLTTDQRDTGFPRIVNDTVDMGAFEAFAGCIPFPRSASGSLSLNNAITCFNSETDPGEYQINLSGNITLDASTVAIDNPNPGISLRMDGNGYSVDGQNLNGVRPFTIQAGSSVTMQAITVTHGLGLAGAGIHNSGTLTLNYSMVSDNNSVLEDGGGIYNNGGTVTLNNSTIYHNQGAEGGAVYNSSGGAVSLVNSTISSNEATDQSGGGIASHGVLTVTNSTIADNTATDIGGLRTHNGTTTLVNTLIANNVGGDCTRTSSSTLNASYTLIESGLGCVNGTNTNNLTGDPNLGPLQNNGGPTLTYELLDGSPAIDAGSDAGALDADGQPLTTDQRGANFWRPIGHAVDIGAYEHFTCVAFPIPAGSSADLDIAIRCFNAQTAAGEYGITLTGDIALDVSPIAIENTDPAISLRLTGNGHTVDGQGIKGVRPFTINADTIVAMEAITITRGDVTDNSEGGGGILNYGNLTLANSTIMSNTAGIYRGGGIRNVSGVATLIDTTVKDNYSRNGGGIRNYLGEVTLINTTVSNNTAERLGGGIYNETITGGKMWVINSTISGNEATDQSGGGIVSNGILTVTNSTIADNTATDIGGLRTHNGTTTLVNTLIANNVGGDCTRTSSSTLNASYTLIESGLGCVNGTNINNLTVDPKLGPLQDNGGPTFTHALLVGSPAIDAGSDAGALDADGQPLTTDQRGTGFIRSSGSAVDIGAYEDSDTIAPTAAPVHVPAANGNGWNNTDVTVAWVWADNAGGSGIDAANCTDNSTSSGEGKLQLTATCADVARNVGDAAYIVMVDKTAPTASPTQAPAANSNGWNSTPLIVTWNWADNAGGSGVDTGNCTLSSTTSDEGEIELTATCTDLAGNTGSASYTVKVDETLPIANPVQEPPANADGWNSTPVTVTWQWTDGTGGSGIDTTNCTSTGISSGEGELSLTSTCADLAGNQASAGYTIKVDQTAPTATLSHESSTSVNGWYTSPVTLTWEWADNLSGIDPGNCTTTTVSGDEGENAVSATCADLAGNVGETASLVKVDTLAPTASPVQAPITDANSSEVVIVWNWTDNEGGSGIDATNCPTTSSYAGDGEVELTAACSDVAGNVGNASYTADVDKTAPVASPAQAPAANDNGWSSTPVTITWNWADDTSGSGIDATNCTSVSVSRGEGELQLTATCTDLAGNMGSAGYLVKVDMTAPTANPSPEVTTNDDSTGMMVAWNWTDGEQGSGIDAANCTTTSTAGDEEDVTLTATCTDLAGNVGSATYSLNVDVDADTMAPTANPAQEPAASDSGWNSTPVTVTWNWADDEGGSGTDTANCTAISTSSDEGEVELTATCADVAGNVGNAGYPLKIDRTAPVISTAATSAPNAAGWYTSSVTVQFTCTDALSGIVEGACPAPQTLEDEGEIVVSTAQTITDAAGNISEPSNVVTMQIDKTPPSLDPVVSPNGIVVGNPATVTAGATDPLSGIANQSCDAVDTGTEGVKRVTCVAEDHAGNTASVTVEVLVESADGTNPTETGSTHYLFLPGIVR